LAFADPQSVTINAIAQSLPRVSSGTNSGVFRKDDATVQLTVSHNVAKGRAKRMVRLDHSKLAADVFLDGVNVRQNGSVWLATDFPEQGGYTVAEAKQIVDALTAYLTASSGARATQLLGGEN
jgi:hypothetical protein